MTTTTTNQGLVLPASGDLNDVPTHLGLYNAGVEPRLVQNFTGTVDRDARNPTPGEGELSFLRDLNRFDYHDGSSWVPLIGSWAPYTPDIIPASGTFSLGNGTFSARYVQLGKTVHFKMKLIVGSTSTFGSGANMLFTLPPVLRNTSIDDVFQAVLIDISGGTAAYRTASGFSYNPDNFGIILNEGTTGIFVSPSQPWPWSNGDIIRVSGTYEAA